MKTGMGRDIRGRAKAERAYIKRWELKQQEKLKAKYGIEKQTPTDIRAIRGNGETGRTDTA